MEFSVKEETGDCDWNDDDGGDYDNHCGYKGSNSEAQVRKLLQQMLKDRPGGQQGEKLMVMMTMIVNYLRQSYLSFFEGKTIVSQENVQINPL